MRLCAASSVAQNSAPSGQAQRRGGASVRSANQPASAIIDSIAGDSVVPTGRGVGIHG